MRCPLEGFAPVRFAGARAVPYPCTMSQRTRGPLLFALAGAATLVTLTLAAGLSHRGSYRYLNVFQEVWGLTRANYVEPVDEEELLRGAYRGMLASVDAAGAYLAPGDEKLLAGAEPPGRVGIDLLPGGGVPVVVRVEPGSEAESQGISIGDQVWKIDGQSVRLASWPVLRRRLAGTPGESVEIEVLDIRTFDMRTVKLPFAAPAGPGFQLSRHDGPVVVLRLAGPSEIVAEPLRAQLGAALAADPGAALLIDLRGSTGLEPSHLTRLAGVLFPGGPLLKLVARSGPGESVTAPELPRPGLPARLFVLTDGTTAGTGEALAAILRQRSAALVIGRPTYGMAGVPELIPLAGGAHVLLSTREMRTPTGESWSEKGIEPVKIITASGPVTSERDSMLEAALAWIREGAPLVAERPAA